MITKLELNLLLPVCSYVLTFGGRQLGGGGISGGSCAWEYTEFSARISGFGDESLRLSLARESFCKNRY